MPVVGCRAPDSARVGSRHGRRPRRAGMVGSAARGAPCRGRQRIPAPPAHAGFAGYRPVALAVSFATSTAVFNTTYNAQARIDAELTNGADVAVTGSTAFAPSSMLSQLKALPGAAAVQPMQHRFAYVGNDLQDLYGIDPAHLGEATTMSNS